MMETESNTGLIKQLLWRWGKRALMGGGVFLLVLMGAAWLGRDWIASRIQGVIDARLAARGFHVNYEFVGLKPLRGFVIKDLTVYKTAAKTETVARLTDFACRLSPLALFLRDGNSQTLALSIKDGTLTLFQGEDTVALKSINALWDAAPDELDLRKLEANFQGLDLEINGRISLQNRAEDTAETAVTTKMASQDAGIDLSPVFAAAQWIHFAGKEASRLKVSIDRDASGRLTIGGELSAKDGTWQEIPLDHLRVPFEIAKEDAAFTVGLKKADLGYEGGRLVLTGSLDLPARTFLIERLESGIDPVSLYHRLAPEAALPGIRFVEPPMVSLESSRISLDRPQSSTLKGTLKSGAGMLVPLSGGQTLAIQRIEGAFSLENGTLRLPDFQCRMAEGTVNYAGTVNLLAGIPSFSGDLQATGLSLHQVTELSGGGSEHNGRLSLSFQGGGQASLGGLKGLGKLSIEGGDFISIPVFGKLRPLLDVLHPGGRDMESSSLLVSDYGMEGGVFSCRNLSIKEGLVEIKADGRVDLVNKNLDMVASAQSVGITKIFTHLVGKALEIEARGPLDSFEWRFKNVPGLDSVTNFASGVGGRVIGTAGDAGGAVIRAAGKTVKGVSRLIPGLPRSQDETQDGSRPGLKNPLKKLFPGKEQ
ncbi:MAG: hypothetical protein IT576_01950 [Verrucomicrobiales bacterium]|nr:hypothetical protein [Verrucomicrobiales bacterium]